MQEATHDELAGIADLFGGLTRADMRRALTELAFRQGREVDEATADDAIDEAVDEYYLVVVEDGDGEDGGDGGEDVLIPGPVAFPTLPPDAEDLPYILDEVPERSVDRDAVVDAVAELLLADAAIAVEHDDADRAAHLLDATYDLEAWGDVDLGDVRDRLDEVA